MQEDKIILYIEDDAEARYLMADIIRYKGYIYIEASRGLEGIKLAEQHNPDLILIDLNLPDMQGYEVTTHLKTIPNLAQTPIIAITAETYKNVKEMVLTAGCDGYIPKPINVSEFIFKIEEYLSGHKEHMEPDEEYAYLQRYNIQLVNRLKKKLTELEKLNYNLSSLNNELFNSKEELAHYNDRLFYLNNLANYLRTLDDPFALLKLLPSRTVEGFQIKRCVVFELQINSGRITPLASAGIPLSELQKIEVQLSAQFAQQLEMQGGILWIKDLAEIVDDSLSRFCELIHTSSFIIGNLSNLGQKRDNLQEQQFLHLEQQASAQPQSVSNYLVFMDQGNTGKNFHTYEVRIIKSLLHSVAVIYENMLLHTHLITLYKIKSEQAIRDEMTGAYNYRYFIQELERETNRSNRFKTGFSLLMIDIDHFKQLNDTFGHLIGDQILKQVSRLFKQNTRTTDTVSRYGGEEFTIIMPGLEKSAALTIAEKLRKLIESYRFCRNLKQKECKVTVSIGLSSYPENGKDPQELLRIADSALYEAKEKGRNKVVLG